MWRFILLAFLAAFPNLNALAAAQWADEPLAVARSEGTTVARLNEAEFEFDNKSGCLLRLTYPGVGNIIDVDAAHASLIDLACPTDTYPPLRLGSRFSSSSRIYVDDSRATIILEELGNSYSQFEKLDGRVRARVDFTAMDDGRSISTTATIDNQSGRPIPQIFFPDLMGLCPLGGSENTSFRLTHRKVKPFQEIIRNRNEVISVLDNRVGDNRLSFNFWGAHNDPSCGRWFDWGWNRGGLSGYQREWGYGTPVCKVWLVRDEAIPDRMRVCFENQMQLQDGNDSAVPFVVENGQVWTSPPFILTPHRSGWPKGIEPYRTWVQSHPWLDIARHIKEDLAYRSIYMTEIFEHRPGEPSYFKFSDLPELAREAKEHEMHEIVCLFITRWCVLPYAPAPNLGTEQELADAVRKCKEIGVDISPFLEAVLLREECLKPYGLKPALEFGAHSTLIPTWPPYTKMPVGLVPSWNEQWQKDCLGSMRRDLIDKGFCSSLWVDSYNYKKPPEGSKLDYHTFARSVRAMCREINPDAAFGSETIDNIEDDCANMDVTWVWTDLTLYMPPANSVFRSPRFAIHLEDGQARWVPRLFIDGTMINVMPRRKIGGLNGTGWIKDDPELSAAIKRCAKLRKQFLPYFTEGVNLGDGFTDGAYENLYMGAYQLPDGLLVLLLNDKDEILDNVPVRITLTDWLKGGSYSIRMYDSEGHPLEDWRTVEAEWKGVVERIEPGEIRIIEFRP